MNKRPPVLYVEGADDRTVVSALLNRHGVPTERGQLNLRIEACGSDGTLLDGMVDNVRANTETQVGFVLDIDVAVADRWAAVSDKFRDADIVVPSNCPPKGHIGQVPGYPVQFGVWLMPDCKSDGLKLEDLCKTLVPTGDPFWSHCVASVTQAAVRIDAANEHIVDESAKWTRFRDVDRSKSEIHTWLSWQSRPGAGLGAAINARVLSHDSSEAIAFLRWVRDLYGFVQLSHLGPRTP